MRPLSVRMPYAQAETVVGSNLIDLDLNLRTVSIERELVPPPRHMPWPNRFCCVTHVEAQRLLEQVGGIVSESILGRSQELMFIHRIC
jgi:hypothetical protein